MYRKNVAGQFVAFAGVNATTGAGLSGATWAARRSLDGVFAAVTGTITEDTGLGFYRLALSQADINGNDCEYFFTATNAVPVCLNVVTTAADPTNAVSFGLSNLDAAISSRMASYTQPTGFLAATFPAGTLASTTNITAGTVAQATNILQIGGTVQTARDIGYSVTSQYLDGAVWFDTAGVAGTTLYLNGTHLNPNSSIANCRSIVNSLNMKRFMVLNGSTVTLDQGYNGFTFLGYKWTLALANFLISNSYFQGATVSGLSNGTGTRFEDCTIGNCTLGPCTLTSSSLTGTITLQAGGDYVLAACTNGSTAGVDAIIDFGAAGIANVGMRDYAGGITVRNMVAGDVFTCTGNGRVTIDATCTGGTVVIAGNFILVNNGSGQALDDTARWNENQNVATAVDIGAPAVATMLGTAVDGVLTMAQVLRISSAGNGGQVSGFPGGPILLKNNSGTKTRVSATVDGSGNRTAISNPDLT